MRFIDEATIEVTAGKGGDGCVSFLRLPQKLKSGPNGGNGGKGGDMLIQASPNIVTLADHSFLRYFKGGNGQNGGSNDKNGRFGKDSLIKVPVGTLIFDQVSQKLLADLTQKNQSIIVAHGGAGGKGNKYFANSTNRAPRIAQRGKSGQNRILKLELKLLADIGLIGLPNAGKSSIISLLSSARAKVADYPFTTIKPQLGVLKNNQGNSVVIADIPGLIKNAHKGAGLGLKFLKHIERTNLFIFVIDLSNENPINDFYEIKNELIKYSPHLSKKSNLIIANKMDLIEAKKKYNSFKKRLISETLSVIPLSTINTLGLKRLIKTIFHCFK